MIDDLNDFFERVTNILNNEPGKMIHYFQPEGKISTDIHNILPRCWAFPNISGLIDEAVNDKLQELKACLDVVVPREDERVGQ